MVAHFISFGCKVSQYESECLKQLFTEYGFIISENENDSDVFIVNSCTVTSTSDKKVRKYVRRLRKLYPESIIAVMGCFPQAFPDRVSDIKDADVITGTKNHNEILNLVLEAMEGKRFISVEPFVQGEKMELLNCCSYKGKTRAFLKIQDGCNQFCSYCIIPYARGRNRSKPIESVKQEVEEFVKNGHKEIVLVGINLAFYGEEFGLRLVDAVETCCSVEGVERIRLGSLEPEKISCEDLKRLSELKQFCPQFHLSLQSGCDKTLKAMNRKYTSSQFLQLVEDIRKFFPECAITTDVMTGFPTESEEDFKQSLDFVKKVKFSSMHIFPYSVRSGTRAEKMPEQVPENIKHSRASEMTEVANEMTKEFLSSQVGKVFPVLFEKESSPDYHQGYTPNYTFVKVYSKNFEKSLRKSIYNVKITGYDNECCIGNFIDY